MRLLASVGVFEEREVGNFALTPLGELLRTGVPGSMRSSVLLFAGVGIQDSWKDLEYCVQTGEPAFRRNSPDADPFSQIARNPEMAKVFDEAMATFAPLTAAAIAASYDFSPFGKLVDVGGGNGSLLIGILKANPNLHGIVFDLPHAAEKRAKKDRRSRIAVAMRGCRRRLLQGSAEPAPTPTSSSTSFTTGTTIARPRFCKRSIARCRRTASC